MPLRPDQLGAALQQSLQGIYLISGDETLLVQEACDAVLRNKLTEVVSGLNSVDPAVLRTQLGNVRQLLRLKQVCNHPAHYHMDGSSLPSRSGKLDYMTQMIEEAVEEGDRSLIFTQLLPSAFSVEPSYNRMELSRSLC